MLATQRQDVILAEVARAGAVRVADLVERLDVSDMTVRRDIAELARRGQVRRVHGGAVALHPAHEPAFASKRDLAEAEKDAIAAHAVAGIVPDICVALSAGTTTHRLAEAIAARPDLRPLTVVTNSLPAAQRLHRTGDRDLTVVLTGGTPTPSDALVGPLTVSALAGLRVDRLYLGAHGIDAEAGLTTPNLLEAEADRALIAAAAQVIVLADHTKWGVVGLARIAGLDAVDTLVTDDRLPAAARRALAEQVGELDLVAVARPAPGAGVDPATSV